MDRYFLPISFPCSLPIAGFLHLCVRPPIHADVSAPGMAVALGHPENFSNCGTPERVGDECKYTSCGLANLKGKIAKGIHFTNYGIVLPRILSLCPLPSAHAIFGSCRFIFYVLRLSICSKEAVNRVPLNPK